jgi:hypothetical protein
LRIKETKVSNGVHFNSRWAKDELSETPQPNLSLGMKWLLGTYTRRFNRRHRYWGHLFGGRSHRVSDPSLLRQIDVLDAQAHTIHQSQPAAIKKTGHQLGRSLEMGKYSANFLASEDNR